VRYLLQPLIAPYGVFQLFIVACLAVQYLFGYRFALAAVVASTLVGEYFFVEPYGSFEDLGKKDLIISVNFLLVTGVAVFFMEKLRRSSYSRQLLLKVMESRHRVSLLRENDRLHQAKKSNEAWAILEELITDYDDTLFYRYGTEDYKIGPLFYRLATRFKLGDDPASWEVAVHPDDTAAVKANLADEKLNLPFELRLLRSDASELKVNAVVDHFRFMGKHLSLLKVESGHPA
jgi:K+-sensing histidine kinase KdpD